MKMNRLVVLGVILGLAATHVLAAAHTTADLYKSKCQSCHGADGKATAIGKKLGARDFQDPAVTSMSEDDLATITSTGKNKMPAYKGKLKDDQIKALAKYIKEMK
jgi:mono/diheme cytochrome c family protein